MEAENHWETPRKASKPELVCLREGCMLLFKHVTLGSHVTHVSVSCMSVTWRTQFYSELEMFLSSHWKMNFVAKSSLAERETLQAWKVPQSLLSSSVYHSHVTEQRVYRYGRIRRRRWPGPPGALLSAEWASYQRPGYATEPPHSTTLG